MVPALASCPCFAGPRLFPEDDGPRLYCHLRPLAEDLESFSSYKRQLFAELNECFEFFALRGFEQAFVVAIHQFLKPAVCF
jgi:hypothetical protein